MGLLRPAQSAAIAGAQTSPFRLLRGARSLAAAPVLPPRVVAWGCGGSLVDGLWCAPAGFSSPGECPWCGEAAGGVRGDERDLLARIAGYISTGGNLRSEGSPGGAGLGINAKDLLAYLFRLGWGEGCLWRRRCWH